MTREALCFALYLLLKPEIFGRAKQGAGKR
jgi:hypothetical protein